MAVMCEVGLRSPFFLPSCPLPRQPERKRVEGGRRRKEKGKRTAPWFFDGRATAFSSFPSNYPSLGLSRGAHLELVIPHPRVQLQPKPEPCTAAAPLSSVLALSQIDAVPPESNLGAELIDAPRARGARARSQPSSTSETNTTPFETLPLHYPQQGASAGSGADLLFSCLSSPL